MECESMVCYSMGAINSLVDKITRMVANHPMMEDLLRDLIGLREDPMKKFARGKATDERVKVWMKQVREMVYDMEDWIDLKPEGANFSDEDKLQIEEFKYEIREAIGRCGSHELDKQVEFCSDVPGEVAVTGRRLLSEEKIVLVGIKDPRSEVRDLMEIDDEQSEQKEDGEAEGLGKTTEQSELKGKTIVQSEQEEDGQEGLGKTTGQSELKVVSILGQEGLGKTTLAKAIYEDVKGQFMCQAFVSVGRSTSLKTTLVEILRQVKPEADVHQALEKQISEIITELWRFLRKKRYFICIDDVRSTQELEDIKRALPNNKCRSRILTTTRMEDIAKLCSRFPKDEVYKMRALEDIDSKMLFCNCVYAEEKDWPDHLKESSEKMFKVCGGVPLAIITAAGGLLGRTSQEQQVSEQSKKLNEIVLSEFNKLHPESQEMRKILNIFYSDLPLPLKSCLLYMTAFPGNYDIKKDRLIRRWVAEGIIPEEQGKSSWETAESYFDDLVSRRLIQPIFDYSDDEATGCNVQGSVYDFLESLAMKENFVTAGAELMSGIFPSDRVRRVSLHFDVEDEADTMISNSNTYYCRLDDTCLVDSSGGEDEANSLQLPGVRSLAFSGDAGRIPKLSAFKHLRVLDLEDTKGLEDKQLKSIGGLFQLRYLGLGRTNVTKLPPEIMAPKLLSSLDLRRSGVRYLPEIKEKKLVSLLGDQLILQKGVEGMENLEELSVVVVGPDGVPADSMAKLVYESRQLRMVGVWFSRHFHRHDETDRQQIQRLLKAVGESNLKSLFLDNCHQHLLDILVDSLAANDNHLKKLELKIVGCLQPAVPQQMASLKTLTHLHIKVDAEETRTVCVLGSLPKLVLLELDSSATTSPGLQVSGKDGGFPSLKVLRYHTKYARGMGLRFEKCDEPLMLPMPELRRLRVDVDAREASCKYVDFELGMKHLPCLVHVHATVDWTNATLKPDDVEAVEQYIRNQVSQNTNNPVLELNSRRQRPVPRAAGELVIVIKSLNEWYTQIRSSKMVLIHFTASGCKASRDMAPFFADLAKRFRDVVFLKVDCGIGQMKDVAAQYGITGVPTFLFMKGGHTEHSVVGGGPDKRRELENKLNEMTF